MAYNIKSELQQHLQNKEQLNCEIKAFRITV